MKLSSLLLLLFVLGCESRSSLIRRAKVQDSIDRYDAFQKRIDDSVTRKIGDSAFYANKPRWARWKKHYTLLIIYETGRKETANLVINYLDGCTAHTPFFLDENDLDFKDYCNSDQGHDYTVRSDVESFQLLDYTIDSSMACICPTTDTVTQKPTYVPGR